MGQTNDESTGEHQAAARVHEFIAQCEAGEAPDLDEFVAASEAPIRGEVERRCRAYLKLGVLLAIDETAPAPDSAALPGQVGDFRPIRLLGRGGMGAVYLAEQISLGREVALKVLTPRPGGSPDHGERFRREALSVARLRHPNIVRVLTYGEQDPFFYFAMEYVEGQSLAEVVARLREEDNEGRSRILHSLGSGSTGTGGSGSPSPGRLPTARSGVVVAAGIGLRVAEALAYAHEQGIIHRDVKPSNILMQPNGIPLLADFGLAKEQDSVKLSLSGDVIGTPQYMSPEQTRQGNVDERTDVYSLGVTLYELLCGQLPFNGTTLHEVFEQVQQRDPAPLRKAARPDLPVDLETIVLTAMEKAPERRYQSAADMAEDLRRFLDLRPIVARPVGRIERSVRWARRHPARVLGVGLLLLLLIAAPVVLLLTQRAEEEEARAERATRQRDGLRLLAEASTAMETSPQLALLLAIEGAERAPGLHANNILYSAWAKNSGPGAESRSLLGHEAHIRCVAYSPDGRTLVSGSGDGTAKVWDVETGSLRFDIPHQGEVIDVRWGAGGRVITASTDGTARVWDAGAAQERSVLRGHHGPVYFAALCGDRHAVTASLDGTLVRWDVEARTSTTISQQLFVYGYDRYVDIWGQVEHTLATSSDGRLVAAVCRDNRVRAWATESGELLLEVEPAAHPQSITLSDSGSHVAVRLGDTANVWNVATRELRIIEAEGPIGNVRLRPDGSQLALSCAGARGSRIRLHDVGSGRLIREVADVSPSLNTLRYSQDGTRIAHAVTAGEVLIWDTRNFESPVRVRGHELLVLDLVFAPNGQSLATVAEDRTVRVWNIDAQSGSSILTRHKGAVTAIDFAGSRIATGSSDRTFRVIDLESGENILAESIGAPIRALGLTAGELLVVTAGQAQRFRVEDPKGTVGAVVGAAPWSLASAAARPDRGQLVFACRRGLEGRATVHDSRDGALLFGLVGHEKAVRSAEYSLDGKRIVTASFDGTARVWNADDGGLVTTFEEGSDVRSACFSPNGERVVTGVWDKTAAIWEVSTGRKLQTLSGHFHSVESASFSPDGSLVVTASLDGTARLWDAENGDCLATLRHPTPAKVARISPDSRLIVVGCADGAAYQWPYPPLPAAKSRKSRELTSDERRRYDAVEPGFPDATVARGDRSDVAEHLYSAWFVLRRNDAKPEEYQAALEHVNAARAAAVAPDLAMDLEGAAHLRLGDADRARGLLENALAAHVQRTGSDDLRILSFLSLACRWGGAHEESRAYLERARPLAQEAGHRWGVVALYKEACARD